MYAVVFALLLLGLCALFDVTPKNLWEAAKGEKFRTVSESLRDAKLEKLKGRQSFVERRRNNFIFALKASGLGLSASGFTGITALFVLAGIVLGMLMKNGLLSIVAGVFCAWIPYQYLNFRSISFKRLIHSQLEAALTPITNAYMQTDDLVSSVENCLPQIDEPLAGIFSEEILWKIKLGGNIEKALREADIRVNNRYFHEWCEVMIRCQQNRNQKIGLLPIARRLTDLKRIQARVDTATMTIWKDHIVMSMIAVGSLPVIKLINADWYSFLQNTTFGKIIVAATFAAVGLGTLYVFKVNKPVALED